MKNLMKHSVLVLSLMFVMAFALPVCVSAATSLDDLSLGTTNSQQSNNFSDVNNGGLVQQNNNVVQDNSQNTNTVLGDNAVGDYLKNYTPITQENMQSANRLAGPVAKALGTIAGFIVMIVSAGIFVVTALDLVYIALPITRPYLNPNYAQGGNGAGEGMLGGMGGYGRMGGMGMGGMQAASQNAGGIKEHTWVSDEAIAAVMSAQPASAGGMQAGLGGGYGAMGMGMQGMGMQQAPQKQNTKSVIGAYFKKRVFFLILFAICTTLLMSSIFTKCGLNLADLLSKVLDKFNGAISNVSIGQ